MAAGLPAHVFACAMVLVYVYVYVRACVCTYALLRVELGEGREPWNTWMAAVTAAAMAAVLV